MKTEKEILERIESSFKENGALPWHLCYRLPFKKVKKYVGKMMEDRWKIEPRDRISVIKQMRKEMPWAWECANNKSLYSLVEFLKLFEELMWLIGDEIKDPFGNPFEKDSNFKETLCRICDYYGWPSTNWDDRIKDQEIAKLTKRLQKVVTVLDSTKYSEDEWPPTDLTKFFEWIQQKILEIPHEHREDAIIIIDTDESKPTITISYDRMETDEELFERVKNLNKLNIFSTFPTLEERELFKNQATKKHGKLENEVL